MPMATGGPVMKSECLDQADANIAEHDDEYDQVLITFHQAKEALQNARVARDFYPVVVPAATFIRTRKGKGKGKGKRKSKGRGRGKSSGKSRGKGRGPSNNYQPGRAGKGYKNTARHRADAAKGRPSNSQSASASVDADPPVYQPRNGTSRAIDAASKDTSRWSVRILPRHSKGLVTIL